MVLGPFGTVGGAYDNLEMYIVYVSGLERYAKLYFTHMGVLYIQYARVMRDNYRSKQNKK